MPVIANDPLEMKLLTQAWSTYLASLRLKLLLSANAQTITFLTTLQFKACEENFAEALANSLTPFCNEDIPDYKLSVEIANQHYELSHFESPSSWQINSQPLALFLQLSQGQAKFLAQVLDNFEPFAVLARIRVESRLASYKEKYLQQPLMLQNVISEGNEFFLVLPDGNKAKLLDLDS